MKRAPRRLSRLAPLLSDPGKLVIIPYSGPPIATSLPVIAAIAIWTAGLISLPSLYVQRAHVTSDDALYRMQRMTRFAFVALISPAAFIAVTSLFWLRPASVLLLSGASSFAISWPSSSS